MTLLDIITGGHEKILRPSGGCHNCPRKLVDFVPATLKPTKTIWVGEGPGATEVEEGEGFVGKAGQLMRRVGGEVGITEFSCTNIIHCRPALDRHGKNTAPKPKEIDCCLSQFVLDEIRDYPIVVLCGAVALSAIFPGARATHYRGNVAYHPDFPGQRFYSTYHPSAILRNPNLEHIYRQELERLTRIEAGEPAPSWTLLQGGGDEWSTAFAQMLTAPLISLDLETPNLKSWDPHTQARSFSITADGKTAVYVGSNEPHWIAALTKLCAYLEKPEKGVVASNIGFDLDWLEHEANFTVRCTGIHDIGVIWYQAKQYKQPSQKELVSRELDGYRHLVYQPSKERDLTLLAKYNAEDVIYAMQLFRKGIRLLSTKTRDLVTRVLGPTSLVLRQITSSGIYLREDYRRQQIEQFQDRRHDLIKAWSEADPNFLPSKHETGKGLADYLFNVCRLPVLSKTDKGRPSVDQPSIKRWVQDGASYLKYLLEVKEIDKILSTYLIAYDKHIGFDSRVHSQYIHTRTDTGRSNSQDPNAQNIPRLLSIRDLFGVPPGSLMLEGDLSQMEFRIMVCLAHDETGIDMYLRGEDAHTTTAKHFAAEPTKEQRNYAKPINFALLYDGNAFNVKQVAFNDYGLDWTDTQCQDFTIGFFETYKRLPEFTRLAKAKLIQNRGWFESILGHIFYYKDWDHEDNGKRDHAHRSSLNSEAQGPCAQICFAIMVQSRRLLNERGLQNVRFINTVHDSFLLELPNPDTLPQVVAIIEEARGIVYEWIKAWFVVPLVMDYNSGSSWGNLSEYNLT